MSRYRYGRTSLRRLATCHEHLQTLMVAVLADPECPSDVSVICGHRNEADQNKAFAGGRSGVRWPNSRHNRTPSLAVDVAPYVGGKISWDWKHYHPLAKHVKAVWSRLLAEGKVTGTLEWGGDWRKLKDGPHWQINL